MLGDRLAELPAMSRSFTEDGAVPSKKDKHTYEIDYPDVAAAPNAQLLPLSVTTSGRWGGIIPSRSENSLEPKPVSASKFSVYLSN